MGMSGLLVWTEEEKSETTAPYVAFLSAEPGCWPHVDDAPSEDVPAAVRARTGAGRAQDNGPGARRLMAGSIESRQLVSSLVLHGWWYRFPRRALRCGLCRGKDLFPPLVVPGLLQLLEKSRGYLQRR